MNEEITHTNFKSRFTNMSLAAMVATAILASLVLVIISYLLYINSDRYKYDIARPDVQSAVNITDTTATQNETTPVDAASVKQLQEIIDSQLKALDAVEDFDQTALGDEALNLE